MAKPLASEDIRNTRLVDALSERYLAYALSTINFPSIGSFYRSRTTKSLSMEKPYPPYLQYT